VPSPESPGYRHCPPSADPNRRPPVNGHIIFRYLLERSGVLREPTVGGVDFIHRTFQEYLAGKAAVEGNAIGELVRNAHDDQWREVVIMAAGHAQPHQCDDLLRGLLDRAEEDQELRLLALACLQASKQIEPDLRRRVESVATGLMPPKSITVAEGLAVAGDFVLDLLPMPNDEEEAAAITTTAMRIGGDDAFEVIARIASNSRWSSSIQSTFINAWDYFDSEKYTLAVIAKLDLSNTLFWVKEIMHRCALQPWGMKTGSLPVAGGCGPGAGGGFPVVPAAAGGAEGA
jgi:hypothetical protein